MDYLLESLNTGKIIMHYASKKISFNETSRHISYLCMLLSVICLISSCIL